MERMTKVTKERRDDNPTPTQILPSYGSGSIYIVLTRSETLLSRMICFITGAEYTHASLSLDRSLNYMFSFGRRWTRNPFVGCFRREDINEGVYANAAVVPGTVIRIDVTTDQYNAAARLVGDFLLNNHLYGYNYFGLMKQTVGRTHYSEHRFFCSEFVYYILRECGIIARPIPRGHVRPQDFLWVGEPVFQGDLREFQKQVRGNEQNLVTGNEGALPKASNVVRFPSRSTPEGAHS